MDFYSSVPNYTSYSKAMERVNISQPWLTKKMHHQQRWSPYSFEGGSTAAISGENFVVAGSDTRMSQQEVNILTRNAEKLHVLNDNIILNTAGFHGDVLQMKRVLDVST